MKNGQTQYSVQQVIAVDRGTGAYVFFDDDGLAYVHVLGFEPGTYVRMSPELFEGITDAVIQMAQKKAEAVAKAKEALERAIKDEAEKYPAPSRPHLDAPIVDLSMRCLACGERESMVSDLIPRFNDARKPWRYQECTAEPERYEFTLKNLDFLRKVFVNNDAADSHRLMTRIFNESVPKKDQQGQQ